jgi:hypothetical protein
VPPGRGYPVAGFFNEMDHRTLRRRDLGGGSKAATLPVSDPVANRGFQNPGYRATPRAPRAIIERLNKELRLAITSPDMQKRLVAEGTDPGPSTPEQYAANLEREEAKWAALIKKLGLKFE